MNTNKKVQEVLKEERRRRLTIAERLSCPPSFSLSMVWTVGVLRASLCALTTYSYNPLVAGLFLQSTLVDWWCFFGFMATWILVSTLYTHC